MTTYNTIAPTTISVQPTGIGRIFGAGILAAIISAVANVIIFLLATSFTPEWNTVNTPMGAPISAPVVALTSVMAALVAAGVFALLPRFVRQPVRVFRIVAVVVFILMLASPFSLPGAPLSMIAALLLMHTVSAVVITFLLTSWATRSR